MPKLVFNFKSKDTKKIKNPKNILGGKGANLSEMGRMGLPVPPGFTISTEVCDLFYKNKKKLKPKIINEINRELKNIEKDSGKKFGDLKNPLLLSVRSGARVSMPGMMDTILNLGLNDKTVIALANKTSNMRFAKDSYRRFIQMYANVVMGVESYNFEELIENYKLTKGVLLDTDLDEDDWDGWKAITKQIGDEVSIVGDDLFVTNKKILEKGINNGSANSILIKVNQIGTVSETFETISLANQNNINTVISHRSGETEDTFISDLAVGIGAGQIKTGAPSRSDRTAKYNRLLMINSDNNFSFEGMNGIKQ